MRSAYAATVTARPTMRRPRRYGRSSRGRMRSALFASDTLAASSCQTCGGIAGEVTGTLPSRVSSLCLLDLAPPAGAVVGDDLPEHLAKGVGVDLLVLAYPDGASRLMSWPAVIMPSGSGTIAPS